MAAFAAADLIPLLFCKYSPAHWFFPFGISFLTFQSLGYIADVFKKKIEPQKNLLDLSLFISFFPTVSSGPIQRAGNLIPQFQQAHSFDYKNSSDGMKLFAWGMFKKLLIADRIALYVNCVYGNLEGAGSLALMLATALYLFQIYCDFSGFSDMAIGAARYLGFDAGKNFDHPLLSQSVGEFWRRWHISLSSWLRDYVYIPLGGSRVALPRIYLNLIITFLVSGMWHGSTWGFALWGILHGVYLCGERAARPIKEKIKIPAWINIPVTFCLVSFSLVFFRAVTLRDAFFAAKKILLWPQDLARFFQLKGDLGFLGAVKTIFSFTDASFGYFSGILTMFGLLLLFCVLSIMTFKKDGLSLVAEQKPVVRILLYMALVCMILFLTPNSYSTNFIYQNF